MRKIFAGVLILALLALAGCGGGATVSQTDESTIAFTEQTSETTEPVSQADDSADAGAVLYSDISCQYDGWRYYYEVVKDYGYDVEHGNLVRTSADGKTEEVLSVSYENENRRPPFIVDGEWIYYGLQEREDAQSDEARWDGSIYKMRTDGSERQKISPRCPSSFAIYGYWLYYNVYPTNVNGQLYRCRLDGSNEKLLVDSQKKNSDVKLWIEEVYGASQFLIDGEQIYYKFDHFSSELWTMKLDGANKKLLVPSIWRLAGAENGRVVYTDWVEYTQTEAGHEVSVRIVNADGTNDRAVIPCRDADGNYFLPYAIENDWIYCDKMKYIGHGGEGDSDQYSSDDVRVSIDGSLIEEVKSPNIN